MKWHLSLTLRLTDREMHIIRPKVFAFPAISSDRSEPGIYLPFLNLCHQLANSHIRQTRKPSFPFMRSAISQKAGPSNRSV